MTHWQTSEAWRRYKATWDEIPTVATLAKAEAVADHVGELDRGLALAFPTAPGLGDELSAALGDRAAWRVQSLTPPPRGRLPRPDWSAELSQAVDLLDHLVGALAGLRGNGVTDPWIANALVPETRLFLHLVESHLRNVTREPSTDPETQALIARATASAKAGAASLALP